MWRSHLHMFYTISIYLFVVVVVSMGCRVCVCDLYSELFHIWES